MSETVEIIMREWEERILPEDLARDTEFLNKLLGLSDRKGKRIFDVILKLDENGKLVYFEEKPILHEYPVSMGIYVMEPKVIDFCKPNLDIASDIIPTLIKNGLPVYGYITEKPHYDIGTFKHLDMVKRIIEKRRSLT